MSEWILKSRLVRLWYLESLEHPYIDLKKNLKIKSGQGLVKKYQTNTFLKNSENQLDSDWVQNFGRNPK